MSLALLEALLIRGKGGYSMSDYFEDVPVGQYARESVTCEYVCNLTFSEESFDLVISQDVIEHVSDPDKAFRNIDKILKPNSVHIFTVPHTLSMGKKCDKGNAYSKWH